MVFHVSMQWFAYCIEASLMNIAYPNMVIDFHQEKIHTSLIQVPNFIKIKTIIVYNFFFCVFYNNICIIVNLKCYLRF